VETMAGPVRWRISGRMLSTATPPAKRQPSEVLTSKIGLQIASVYAGLKGTNPALWYHPTIPGAATANLPVNELR